MPEVVPGRIEIAPRAVARLASRAVLECYGVVGLASPGLSRLLPGNSSAEGVRVRKRNEHIVIDLYIVVEYGTRISEVAHNVMEAVKYSLEKALGVDVQAVNVHVQGLRMSDGG